MGKLIRQLDVQKVIAGAIKAGMPPFRVRVDQERGVIDLLPIDGSEPFGDEDALDAEIRAFANGKG